MNTAACVAIIIKKGDDLKNFLLKSIPYILSFVCGIALFFIGTIQIENQDWTDLIVGIASSLVAIPLIFLVYNYVDYRASAKVNQSLSTSLTFEINAYMLKLVLLLRKIMGVKEKLSWKAIQRMVTFTAPQIKKNLKITKNDLDTLHESKEELDDLVFRAVKSSVLAGDQVQTLATMVNELSRVINERKFRGDARVTAKYLEELLSLMDDWFDSCERAALQNHQHFQLAINQNGQEEAAK